ncbi:YlxM family DNA-binding protein [Christensenellaceae bacterium NSJ-44]|uniref:UPF0122 protein H8699_12065 n=1 Tax=Luoshenia tenuis TaxID=2763654 RepID=A0A926D1S6_9FIRM|nr:YlxM family DNA-binding protein [Luoshenia tenuis]MBC8530168.1 YlxM family DNA-binding protein [Luoshenia tenuis]
MEQRLRVSLLLQLYGAFLTERQRTALELHYDQDFSLAEVAELSGISRQGVYDAIHRGENLLEDAEKRLGLLGRVLDIRQRLTALDEAVESIPQTAQSAQALRAVKAQLKDWMDVWEAEYGL